MTRRKKCSKISNEQLKKKKCDENSLVLARVKYQ